MTSQSPRIYLYKITFEEVPYYYYGVKKEKYFNEEYWGSPKTHKWVWDFYTPKKQILEFFEFSDEGYIEAQEVEKRLIRPFYQIDKWCLNENCNGILSLKILKAAGKKAAETHKNNNTGLYNVSLEKRIENGKKAYELGVGVHSRTKEKMSEDGRKGAKTQQELCIGIHGKTKEQIREDGRKGGNKVKELGLGIHGFTKQQRIENARNGGKVSGKNVGNQKWMCIETGFISNPGGLTRYQKSKNIDTSKRVRVS